MNIKGILFDKDGTLLDFNALWVRIAEAGVSDALAYFGVPAEFKSNIMKAIGVERGIASIESVFCCGSFEDNVKVLYKGFSEYKQNIEFSVFSEFIGNAVEKNFDKGELKPVSANLPLILSEMKSEGLSLGIVTNDNKASTEKCLDILGISNYFGYLSTYDNPMPPKPNPTRLWNFCDSNGFTPAEVVMVGDTLNDMLFAKNAGAVAVGISADCKNREILERRADFVIGNMSELFSIIN